MNSLARALQLLTFLLVALHAAASSAAPDKKEPCAPYLVQSPSVLGFLSGHYPHLKAHTEVLQQLEWGLSRPEKDAKSLVSISWKVDGRITLEPLKLTMLHTSPHKAANFAVEIERPPRDPKAMGYDAWDKFLDEAVDEAWTGHEQSMVAMMSLHFMDIYFRPQSPATERFTITLQPVLPNLHDDERVTIDIVAVRFVEILKNKFASGKFPKS